MKTLITFSLLTVSLGLYAKSLQIDLKDGKVLTFKAPKTWKVYQNVFGVPYMLGSPKKKDSRITIGVTPTKIEDLVFDKKGLKDSEGDYVAGRKRWLQKYNGTFDKLIPFETWKNQKKLEFHAIGYKYKLNGIKFEEITVQVNCGGEHYHLKALHRPEEFPGHEKKIKDILLSFDCQLKAI